MIKPSSGGFDMEVNEQIRIVIWKRDERIKELEQLNDTIRNDYNEGLKRIKELEDELTTFIDEVNRLTAIKKELEQELELLGKDFKQIYNDYQNNCKELERYKALKKKYCTACSFYAMFKKEFTEAKE